MTFEQAKRQFFNELKEQHGVLTDEELIARLGKTTIRCYWADYTDYLCKDHQITEKQYQNWGQVL